MLDEQPAGIYRHACFNCGGDISDLRLRYRAPCEKCLLDDLFHALKQETSNKNDLLEVLELYTKYSKRGRLAEVIAEEKLVREFDEFFRKTMGGFQPWSAQLTWARRALRGQSFSIIAPTGMGKTSFSLVLGLFYTLRLREKQGSVLLAFPTTTILLQAYSKLVAFAKNLGVPICGEESPGNCVRVLVLHGKMNKRDKEISLSRLANGDFDILLTTSAFIHKNHELVMQAGQKNPFKLIVMDDVDAVLRSGKAVKRLLNIIGISDDQIELGLTLIKLRARLSTLKEEERDKVLRDLEEVEKSLKAGKSKINTVVIVNSATGKPRGLYTKLFKVFLNFEAGSKPEAIRNIVDAYVEPVGKIEDEVITLVKKLGDGILVFVPLDKGIEYAEYIAALLRENGVKAEAFHSKKSHKILEEFSKGNIDVLVGVATYYGVMVRGVDFPQRVKYAIFAGTPRHKFSSKIEDVSPTDVIRLLNTVINVMEGVEKEELSRLAARLSSRLRRISPGAVAKLREDLTKLLRGEPVEETPLLRDLREAVSTLKQLLSREDVWVKLMQVGDIGVVKERDQYYLLIPDAATYVQASGRTSRLYPGGLTKGLSIVIVDDKRLLNGLVRRMRWYYEGFEMRPLSEIDIEKLKGIIEEERKRVKDILEGRIPPGKIENLVKSVLLVVESPNKAKTIANFFGRPSVRIIRDVIQAYEVAVGNYILTVVASGGHIYDLVVDEPLKNLHHMYERGENIYGILKLGERFIPIYTDIKKCSNGHQFMEDSMEACPRCGSRDVVRKLRIIEALRELASEVDMVLIGTDPDVEGEKIGWDLMLLLKPFARSVSRVEFHEITRRALQEAISSPRDFDIGLVEAQIVRRIEDRWLGFSLSKMVQRYMWTEYCYETRSKKPRNCCEPNRNLSAGRVQTPVLKYIVEETDARRDKKNWRYELVVETVETKQPARFSVLLTYPEASLIGLTEEPESAIGKKCLVEVTDLREETLNPLPPYTTDTLLEDASRLLGVTSTKAMELAQDLFELGLITYHRTDSTRISDVGLSVARQYLEEVFGESYKEVFKPRTWGTGGAHEAIRPTRPVDARRLEELIREGVIVLAKRITRDHLRLYDLVFRRFIASQIVPARVKYADITLKLGDLKITKLLPVKIVEEGYLRFYNNLGEIMALPEEVGMVIEAVIADAKPRPPPLLRHHDVIKWMKENGIGRPSTYAKIVQTIIDRGYVITTNKSKALIPTKKGRKLLDFLEKEFANVVSVNTTRILEEKMSSVERREKDYQDVLKEIFREVNDNIESKIEVLEKEYYLKYCKHGKGEQSEGT